MKIKSVTEAEAIDIKNQYFNKKQLKKHLLCTMKQHEMKCVMEEEVKMNSVTEEATCIKR